jgi:hypothetical protein
MLIIIIIELYYYVNPPWAYLPAPRGTFSQENATDTKLTNHTRLRDDEKEGERNLYHMVGAYGGLH